MNNKTCELLRDEICTYSNLAALRRKINSIVDVLEITRVYSADCLVSRDGPNIIEHNSRYVAGCDLELNLN